jgi:hypothetical protein
MNRMSGTSRTWVSSFYAGARVVLSLLLFAGCRALFPNETPEDTCIDQCRAQLSQCSGTECERGCALMRDRIAEQHTAPVLACMKPKTQCADSAWAACAVRLGPYADGGGLEIPRPAPEEE